MAPFVVRSATPCQMGWSAPGDFALGRHGLEPASRGEKPSPDPGGVAAKTRPVVHSIDESMFTEPTHVRGADPETLLAELGRHELFGLARAGHGRRTCGCVDHISDPALLIAREPLMAGAHPVGTPTRPEVAQPLGLSPSERIH